MSDLEPTSDERLGRCLEVLGGGNEGGAPDVLRALQLGLDPIVLVAPDRRILFANGPAAELTGHAVESLVERRCSDGLGLRTCGAYCTLYEEGAVCGRQCELQTAGGDRRLILKNARLLRTASNQVVGGLERLTDVTEMIELARVMEDERALTEAAFSAVCGEPLLVVDRQGQVRLVSESAAELLDTTARRTQGLQLTELVPDAPLLVSALAALGRGQAPGEVPVPIPRRGHSDRLITSFQTISNLQGAVVGAVLRIRGEAGSAEEEVAPGLVGRSAALRQLASRIQRIAPSDATVLITGETGVGKEAVARAIHACSPRRDRPFYAINCGGLTESLLDNELFGHERGAFTDAGSAQRGKLEACEDGTLLLDEIGCLSLGMQSKLLRVLEQREFHRVGGTRTLALKARVLAATNANLEAEVKSGRFRADLFYRLQSIPIEVPPLRRRREDILPLACHFLRAGCGAQLTLAAKEALQAYAWPGNVRELRNAVQCAAALGSAGVIGVADLPPSVRHAYVHGSGRTEEDEVLRLRRALEEAHYNRARAAAALGISRATLWRRLRQHAID